MSPLPPRLPDWRPRLDAYLAEISPVAFCLGSQDCALFAAGAVRAMTGHDPAAGFRGCYTDVKTGLKRLKSAGYKSHVDLVDALFERVPLAFAQVGDLALIDGPDGFALGLFVGETVACLNPLGLAMMPRNATTRAWRVG